MKKVVTWLMAAVMMVALTACGQGAQESSKPVEGSEAAEGSTEQSQESAPTEKANVRIAALKGPTAMGMLHMMHEAEAGNTPDHYEFTLAGSPDEILGNIIKGEFDIAAVPTNVASVLYNKTQGNVQLAALNTLGVLYCVEVGDSVHSVEDLAGKTVYNLGKGSTPEFALNYLLKENSLDPENDVTVEYKSEAAEVASLMANGEASIAILPQPFVSSLLMQNENVRVAFSVTDEWSKVSEDSTLTMGCIVVQKKFAEEQPEALQRFLNAYEQSVAFANDEKTLETAAQYAEDFDVVKKPIALKAMPECNIVFIEGTEMKNIASGFLQVLFDADPTSVGGAMPDDAFYYNAK